MNQFFSIPKIQIMGKSKVIIILFLLFGIMNANAQEDVLTRKMDDTGFFLSLGGDYSNFQDLKYSAVQMQGLGLAVGLGWHKLTEKQAWEASLNYYGSKQSTSLNTFADANAYSINLKVSWMKNLKQDAPLKIYVGVVLDSDFHFRNDAELGNNSFYYLQGNTLSAQGMLRRQLNKKWDISYGLSIGLFTLAKESTSFAFSAPQEYLESGEFDYLKSGDAINPFRRMQFEPIGKYTRLESKLTLYRGKWALGYNWNLSKYRQIKNYEVTTASHRVTTTFTF